VSTTATVACAACGEQTPAGKRFCIDCGSPVLASCPACGEPNDLEALRDEARAVFESLGAKPWITRADALHTAVAA
jgi:predicted amidophosphoribosyltransferase